jgi:hypothetical protein
MTLRAPSSFCVTLAPPSRLLPPPRPSPAGRCPPAQGTLSRHRQGPRACTRSSSGAGPDGQSCIRTAARGTKQPRHHAPETTANPTLRPTPSHKLFCGGVKPCAAVYEWTVGVQRAAPRRGRGGGGHTPVPRPPCKRRRPNTLLSASASYRRGRGRSGGGGDGPHCIALCCLSAWFSFSPTCLGVVFKLLRA